jgi:hypothetical protein
MQHNLKKLCIDFDGVIHSYTSGWKGNAQIVDPPVDGAIEWLLMLCQSEEYEVYIYSSRSKEKQGVVAMRAWLLNNGFDPTWIDTIEFPTQKPAAYLTIDDRAICFRGTFPSILELDNFKPWNK